MAIPFFSIDLDKQDWQAYLAGLTDASQQTDSARKDLTNSLQLRFPDHLITLLPSARLGFFLAMKHLFKEGDEIIFPTLGFPLYVKIALQLKLKPVLVDVEPDHLTIDPEMIKRAITVKTKGLMVTHLFGYPCAMDQILEITRNNDISLVEDCAQSFDSFYRGQETGTFGDVGIFSTSLMKVPTTLGGGILVTPKRALHQRLQEEIKYVASKARSRSHLKYHTKSLVSMLNSYPLLYSTLSHQIFGLLKRYNPALLRTVLYSGMGLGGPRFDPLERPPLASFQYRVGKIQLDKSRQMTESRRHNSRSLDQAARHHPRTIFSDESEDTYWNRQYHVIRFDHSEEMEEAYDFFFRNGVHVMKEDVWDCTEYQFPGITIKGHNVAQMFNPGLLRIPNNSMLTDSELSQICRCLEERPVRL